MTHNPQDIDTLLRMKWTARNRGLKPVHWRFDPTTDRAIYKASLDGLPVMAFGMGPRGERTVFDVPIVVEARFDPTGNMKTICTLECVETGDAPRYVYLEHTDLK